MHLILLRHAEKDSAAGSDPGLSLRGAEQALSLSGLLVDKRWPKPTRLLASPKRRTQETVRPLADVLGLEIEVVGDLDERRPGENPSEMRQRLRRLVASFETERATCTVWCTHLDWIEEFRTLADSDKNLLESPYDHWSPSQFLVLHLDDLWSVVAFGRAPC